MASSITSSTKKPKLESDSQHSQQRPALFLDVDGVLNSFFLDFLDVEQVCPVFGITKPRRGWCFDDENGNFRSAGQEFVDRVLSEVESDFTEFPCDLFSDLPELVASAEKHRGFVIRKMDGAPNIVYNPAIISRLGRILKDSALNLDAFWCTSWRERAPKHLAPVFDFPEMPDALVTSLGNSKPAAVASIDPNRPLVWLDDDIRCRNWSKLKWLQERAGPTLAIAPLLCPGLSEKQLDEVEEFLRDPFGYHARHGVRYINGAELEDRAAVEAALKDPPQDNPGVLDKVLWKCIVRGWELLAEQVLDLGPPLKMKPPENNGNRSCSIVGGAVNKLPSLVPKLIAAGAEPNDALAGIFDGYFHTLSPSKVDMISWILSKTSAKPTTRHLNLLLAKRPPLDLLQSMVAAGAPVDVPDPECLERSDKMASIALPLHRAINEKCDVAILSALLKGGASIDQTHGNKAFRSHDHTALYMAVAQWNLSSVRFLVEEGADASRVFSGNWTLLYLLEQSCNSNYIGRDETGCSIAKLLLENGASAKGLKTLQCTCPSSGRELLTALDHAEKHNRPKLAAVLKDAADRADKS